MLKIFILLLIPLTIFAGGLNKQVLAYFVYWDEGVDNNSFESLERNSDVITQLAPAFYRLMPDGVTLEYQENITDKIIDSVMTVAKKHNIAVIPMIQNYNPDLQNSAIPSIMGDFDSKALQDMVKDPAKRSEHINNIMTQVKKWDFAGIEVDYEQMGVTVDEGTPYKDNFTSFVQEFASALHNEGKKCAIAIHPKFKDEPTWGGPAAQDYKAIYEAVDYFRIMTYDFSWSTSAPGAICPDRFARDVMSYVTKTSYTNHLGENSDQAGTTYPSLGLNPSKVYLGIAFYGYDWYQWDEALFTTGNPDHDPWYGEGVCAAYKQGSEGNIGRSNARTWKEINAIMKANDLVPSYTPSTRELHKYYWGDYGNMNYNGAWPVDKTYGYGAGGLDYLGKTAYLIYPDDDGTTHYDINDFKDLTTATEMKDNFSQFAGQKVRKVYFEDHNTIKAKLNIVTDFNLAGISVWRLGGEDPENFNVIWNTFGDGDRPNGTTGIKTNEKVSNDILVYPNPVKDHATILGNFKSKKVVKLAVYNIEGKIIHNFGNISDSNNRFYLDTSKYPKGIYVVRFTTENNTHLIKQFVKIK